MTAWARRWSEFPLVWGRLIMPMSVGCTLWTLWHAFVVLSDQGIGRLLDGTIGEVIGVLSIATAALLTAGWWARRIAWMQRGMLLTACLLGSTTITLWAEGVGFFSGGYNLPWLVMTALAWLIEVRDSSSRRP